MTTHDIATTQKEYPLSPTRDLRFLFTIVALETLIYPIAALLTLIL